MNWSFRRLTCATGTLTPQSATIAGAKVRQVAAGPFSLIYGDVDGNRPKRVLIKVIGE